VVIADKAAPYVEEIFGHPGRYTGGHYLFATVLFSYQIFCDFAGYSTIAMGVARLMGVELMVNFRRPYFAASVREFWQRWHISLSTWFRDYLYIPLGGSRLGRSRHYANLLLVFMVSGMWHGANWTFLVWGALHGAALVLETALARVKPLAGLGIRAPVRVMRHLWTLAYVGVAWIFFRADTVHEAFHIVGNLFTGIRLDLAYVGSVLLPLAGDARSPAYAVALFGAIALMETVQLFQERNLLRRWPWLDSGAARWAWIYALGLGIALFGEFGARSFLYFQF
jgi:D-alanyl-lipoteichoic acid acyltransferase DltB (MBOAT superfamily)